MGDGFGFGFGFNDADGRQTQSKCLQLSYGIVQLPFLQPQDLKINYASQLVLIQNTKPHAPPSIHHDS